MAPADINHNKILKIYIALQNEPADVKRDLMATAEINQNNPLTISFAW